MRHKEIDAIERAERHGQSGHANIYVLDQDSEITGFGRHCRLLVSKNVASGVICCREDIRHGLPLSTDADRRKVMSGWQRLHPRGSRLVHISSSEPYQCGSGPSIEHLYRIQVRAS